MADNKEKLGKIVAISLTVLIVLGTIGRIGNRIVVSQWEDSLDGQIAKANRLCPLDIQGLGKMNRIALEENNIVYYVEYNNEMVDLTWIKSNPDVAKKVFVVSQCILNGQDNDGDKFMKEIISKGLGISIDWPSSIDKEHFRISITPEEIVSLQQFANESPSEAVKEILFMNLKKERDSLPTKIDEGLVCTDIIVEEQSIIYKITVDETQYDIMALEGIKDTFKEELLKEWNSSPMTRNFLTLCKIARTGIIWKMTGDTTGQICNIVLDHAYISSHVQTPAQLNFK